MSTVEKEGELNGVKKDCQNCGHHKCMFHGEDRRPVYGDRCWFPVCWLKTSS
jgi:hypothetical protein